MSKEDEEMLNQVIEDIVKLAGPKVCYYKDVDWLKSLKDRVQPQWKPSMAQLNALSIVSKGNITDDIEAIVSLYQDLKKLREE